MNEEPTLDGWMYIGGDTKSDYRGYAGYPAWWNEDLNIHVTWRYEWWKDFYVETERGAYKLSWDDVDGWEPGGVEFLSEVVNYVNTHDPMTEEENEAARR